MTEEAVVITIDLTGMYRFQKGLESNKHVRKAVRGWSITYNDFIVRRFKKFSKGGGDWEPLKRSTSRYKRANRGKILVEYGDLLGSLFKTVDFSANVRDMKAVAGFTEKAGYHRRAKMSMADLATIHQLGLGRVPARRIVVQPPQSVIDKMAMDMQKALERWADDTAGN